MASQSLIVDTGSFWGRQRQAAGQCSGSFGSVFWVFHDLAIAYNISCVMDPSVLIS